jgi:hypothetical protein
MCPIEGSGDQHVEQRDVVLQPDLPDDNVSAALAGNDIPTIEVDDQARDQAALAGPPEGWATSFLEGTAKAFFHHLLVGLASAHGLSAVVTIAEYVSNAGQWLQVAAGGRGLDAEFPVPLVPGIELDLSVPLEQESAADGKPAVTMCCAPAGDPPIGMLVIGGLNIGPGEKIGDTESTPRQEASRQEPGTRNVIPRPAASARGRRVVVVRSDLPSNATLADRPDVATVRSLAEEYLLLPMQRRQRTLSQSGVDQVVICIPAVGVIVWLYIEDIGQSSWAGRAPTVRTSCSRRTGTGR